MIFFIVIFVFLFQATAFDVRAESQEMPVTPYGDFCPQCGTYGTCNSVMTTYDAEKALNDYYKKKGLAVEIEHSGERFIKVRIHNSKGVVDDIIFDRRTGRIRSIY